MNEQSLVAKVWNYAHVLRDDGVSYGDYLGQISFLLFLKMDKERTEALGEASALPVDANWDTLAGKAGEIRPACDTGRTGPRAALTRTVFRGASRCSWDDSFSGQPFRAQEQKVNNDSCDDAVAG
ncbi:type I restriction-modification system subunit M N-terminal domain-containing protein [Sphingomonas sp. TWP1-3-1]|uniref:type I restriction-modification system subunit M N-terminal domain-containing protein n=1 Tax=Sphingomonas sp. TWP1-3-1 TaxID=2804612 RepID=UPI003CEAAEAB